ncbi:MAG TPA: glycosyltransferase family 2 protein [Sphingobacteriaceae bacterium]
MKVTIITVVYNGKAFVADCIDSVLRQSYPYIEYVVVDGGSEDGTVELINSYGRRISSFVSEKDLGIYDAMNKGIAMATGDIIGILNADDFFSGDDILENIVKTFKATGTDIVYGDLFYISRKNSAQVVRKWTGRPYHDKLFASGWMPAHPTFYARKELFDRYGRYDLSYGSAADYELMLRFMHKFRVKASYLPDVFVRMRSGGVSNSSYRNRFKAMLSDYRAMKSNELRFPLLVILMKPLRKLNQYCYLTFS